MEAVSFSQELSSSLKGISFESQPLFICQLSLIQYFKELLLLTIQVF